MKRGSDRYPHNPSPGHTLDEVLKSLRDLIRNDLPAGLAEPPATALSEQPPEAQPDAIAPPDPDPTSGDLVNEVVAGLERELIELDEIHPSPALPPEDETVPEAETADDVAATPPTESEQSFTEDDVHHAIEDEEDAESFAGDEPNHDAVGPADDEVPAIDFDEGDFADEMEPDLIETEQRPATETSAAPEIEPAPGSGSGSEVALAPAETAATFIEPPDPLPVSPRLQPAAPPARLRDSLALIADGIEARAARQGGRDCGFADGIEARAARQGGRDCGFAEGRSREWALATPVAPPVPVAAIAEPEWPDETAHPVPESEAIPLLDDAIESALPPDFAVRVRAIAIQVAARLDHELRRAGRTPIASDVVPTLARILEEALAQEFAQRQNGRSED